MHIIFFRSPGAKNFHPLFTPDYNLANNNVNNNNCNIPSTSEQISTNPFVRLTTSWTSSTIQSPIIHSAQPDFYYDKSSKSHHHHRSTSRHQFFNIDDHSLSGNIPKMPATTNDSMYVVLVFIVTIIIIISSRSSNSSYDSCIVLFVFIRDY